MSTITAEMSSIKLSKITEPKAKVANPFTPVHPSTILGFPDILKPDPHEIDSYPLVMYYLNKQITLKGRKFKGGSFKSRITTKMTPTKKFNILMASGQTTPAEKATLRHGLEWIQYLQNTFEKGFDQLSRFHSMLYSGVFTEKVFRVFEDDGKSDAQLRKPRKPIWSMLQVKEDGTQYRLSVGEDWSIVQTPVMTMVPLNPPDGYESHLARITRDGLEIVDDDGKVTPIERTNGVIKWPDFPKTAKKGPAKSTNYSPSIDPAVNLKIVASWLSDEPTRERKYKGQYGLEEMRDNVVHLKQTLGREPTGDEITQDMICCLLSDAEFREKVSR